MLVHDQEVYPHVLLHEKTILLPRKIRLFMAKYKYEEAIDLYVDPGKKELATPKIVRLGRYSGSLNKAEESSKYSYTHLLDLLPDSIVNIYGAVVDWTSPRTSKGKGGHKGMTRWPFHVHHRQPLLH